EPLVDLLAGQDLRVAGDVGDDAGLTDLEQARGGREPAPVDLHAGFILGRYERRKDCAGIGESRTDHGAWLQALDEVAVDRDVLPRLEDQRDGRTPDTL